MNKTFSLILTFLLGTAAGAIGSSFYFKNKYERLIDEAIDSYKKSIDESEKISKRIHDSIIKPQNDSKKSKEEKNTEEEYNNVSSQYNSSSTINVEQGPRIDYNHISSKYSIKTENAIEDDTENTTEEFPDDDDDTDVSLTPYTIGPGEFGNGDYDVYEFLYYDADENNPKGTLTDGYEPLSDEEIAVTVGSDYYTHFGEYEESRVIIRNEKRKIDYEIVKQYDTYENYLIEKEYE